MDQDKCGGEKGHKLRRATLQAADMAKTAADEWWDLGRHTDLAETYLGIKGGKDWRDNIYAEWAYKNLRRASKVSLMASMNPGDPSFDDFGSNGPFIGISCVDHWNNCTMKVKNHEATVTGYAKNENGEHNVVMCEPFWQLDKPEEVYNDYKNKPKDVNVMSYLQNEANIMLHEIMHIDLISEDREHIFDRFYKGKRVYGPEFIRDWVKDYGAERERIVTNADSYAQFVNAIYFKNKFGFTPPPGSPKSLEGKLDCLKEDKVSVDMEEAWKLAQEFCSAASNDYTPGYKRRFAEEYAKGTSRASHFLASWSAKGSWDREEMLSKCLKSMEDAIKNCEGSDKNGIGGEYAFRDPANDKIYRFKFTPRHESIGPKDKDKDEEKEKVGQCQVNYQALWNEFKIWGGQWAEDKKGTDALKSEIKKCGATKKWKVKRFDPPTSEGFTWRVSGTLPIGHQMWGCVADAVKNAGGPGGLKCEGS